MLELLDGQVQVSDRTTSNDITEAFDRVELVERVARVVDDGDGVRHGIVGVVLSKVDGVGDETVVLVVLVIELPDELEESVET